MQVSKRVVGAILVVALVVGGVSVAWSQVETRAGERVNLDGQLSDIAFAAGDQVDVTATSTDDIYAAGGDLRIRGAGGPSVHAIGGTIRFDNVTFEDASLGGGRVELASGRTADDLLVGAGEVDMLPGYSVGGSAFLAGGRVAIEGPIDRDLWSTGGDIRLDGSVGGSAELEGDHVVVGPKARIVGELRHRAMTIEISPQAVISGGIKVLEPRPRDWWDTRFHPAGFVVGVLMLIALTWGAMLLLPGLMRDSDNRIRQHPGVSLGVGVLIMIAAPVGLALMAVTVIGIPIAFVTLMLLLASLPLAVASAIHTGGMILGSMVGKNAPSPALRFAWTAAAALILCVVGAIPWMGGLVLLLVYALGLGAVSWCIAVALAKGGREPPAMDMPAVA